MLADIYIFIISSGIIAGVGKGIIRITKTNTELIGDLIPVDIAINLMIAAAWGTVNKT